MLFAVLIDSPRSHGTPPLAANHANHVNISIFLIVMLTMWTRLRFDMTSTLLAMAVLGMS